MQEQVRQQEGVGVARVGGAEAEALPRLHAGVEAPAERGPDVAVADVLQLVEQQTVGAGAEAGPVLVLPQQLELRATVTRLGLSNQAASGERHRSDQDHPHGARTVGERETFGGSAHGIEAGIRS